MPSSGLTTELDSHDTTITKETITAAEQKSVPPTTTLPGTFTNVPKHLIPDWYRTGWTSLAAGENPGGSLGIRATESDFLEEILPEFLYGAWYHNGAALFLTALVSWTLAKLNAGIGSVLLLCLFIASYYRTSIRRFRRNTRDDIQREISKFRLEADEESVEWMNSFVAKFWLIFEPVLSALVVENLDNYITDYLPPYLDSIRLTTFTLGTKPFRIESVKTFLNTDPDTVCMDWRVSFIPNDLDDLTPKELEYKVNPKVIMNARIGKGRMGAGIPVMLEDMAFSGHLRIKIKFMSRFPFVKLFEASFLEKPQFDYILKPLGADSFGFDVNVIPGLASFIRDQVHSILGPLMYYPNQLAIDVERFCSGDFDFSAANGVLAVTVYSTDRIKHVSDLVETAPNPYIRFYIDHGQELDRTTVCESTFEPKWNETRYIKINNLNSLLSLELKTSRPGLKDRRLATANFDLSCLDSGDDMAEQEGLDLMLLRNGKHVSNLRVDIRYLPISKPHKRDDGTMDPPVDSNSGVLRLTVHECRDLVTTSEKISPYVRIIVNGIEKHKTHVAKNKKEPKFEDPYEIVVLDKTTFFVRAEVRDSQNDDALIGAFTSYLSDIVRLQEKNDSWWDLVDGDTCLGQIRLSAEWKPIMMSNLTNFVSGHGFDTPPIGVIRFTLWEARDLRNVEMVTGGKSDPYVRILSGYQVRGRTEVIDNNLNPEWGEILYIPVHSLKENFVLEAMDWNARTRDKSLGKTTFKVSEIIQQKIGDQSVSPDVWYESNGVKVDRWERLHSMDNRRASKGDLHYSAEFVPILQLPGTNNASVTQGSAISSVSAVSSAADEPLPLRGLHGSYIRYTPDDLIDLGSYNSGVLKIKIHQVQFSHTTHCYCQVIVDALMPQYKTAKLRGDTLNFDESADMFIKEIDFSRIAIEIKPAHSDEKEVYKLGHWIDSGAAIVRRIMKQKRQGIDPMEGTWFNLMGSDGPARIRLGFEYDPMEDFVLNPDESLDNQGVLTVDLVSATNLMAADKSGTSDPYVIFNVNGEKLYKSETIKKTLNPKWSRERFEVPIQSRVTASIRIEVFDWNHVKGDQPIGSGGITLRGDAVESFKPRMVDIPLDGVSGVSGSVQVKFTWHPQLLKTKKTQTSVLATTRTYARDDVNLEASGPLVRNYQQYDMARQSSESYHGSQLSDPYGSRMSVGSSRLSFEDTVSVTPSSILLDVNNISNATGQAGSVTITLLEARGLRGVDKSGTSDPYVRVKVGKEQIYKTQVIPKTLDPEWNETFIWRVGGEPFIFDFKVKDHNRVKSAVDLGQTRCNLWDLIKLDVPGGDTFCQWLPLFPPGSGELRVNIHFNPSI
ncbi:C2 domain-containing protein [Mucor mucedo]|uniref:C2 domain-containing protein n=1 Tax=Mucor mucedo TaxID=29922 RepID=UPI002220A5FD|nr:C2 domain-containing protein [Mucor mucedo]KAI7885425.1 C2 domain-containing protein [Mucor mucedo]